MQGLLSSYFFSFLFLDAMRPSTRTVSEYEVQIRFDTRSILLSRSLREVADWWADQDNYTPAPVPDAARKPMYSTWYSFHQNITADEVVEQCRLAKEMVKFWIGYWNENREVLLDGDFQPKNPSANYPIIMSSTPEKAIAALYNDMVVPLTGDSYKRVDVVNAKAGSSVVLDLEHPMGRVTAKIYDCLGRLTIGKAVTLGPGPYKFVVPPSGLLEIEVSGS